MALCVTCTYDLWVHLCAFHAGHQVMRRCSSVLRSAWHPEDHTAGGLCDHSPFYLALWFNTVPCSIDSQGLSTRINISSHLLWGCRDGCCCDCAVQCTHWLFDARYAVMGVVTV
jgi:hypothetical protein